MRTPTTVLLLAALLAGCAEAPSTPPNVGAAPTVDVPPIAGEPIPFRTLLHQRTVPVVTSDLSTSLHPASWNETWDRYAARVEPRPGKPVVDHAQETIVLVSLGERGGCDDVRVTDVRLEDGKVVVRSERYDGERFGGACTRQVTWPLHVVAARTLVQPSRFVMAPATAPFDPPAADPAPPPPEPVATRPLASGSFSKIHEDTRVLLHDADAWEALWEEHRPGEPAPEVDFPQESVVAVVVHGPTGCAGIHLGLITYHRAAQAIDVPVVHERAPENAQCLVAFEDVFAFAAIESLPGEARFRDVRPHEEDTPVGPYAFRTLARGTDTALNVSQRNVVTSERQWREAWDAHTAGMSDPPPLPEVDFASERVLMAVRGWRSDQCWDVEVLSMSVGDSFVVVRIRDSPPPPGEACDLSVRRPYHFTTFPVTPKPPLYEEGP